MNLPSIISLVILVIMIFVMLYKLREFGHACSRCGAELDEQDAKENYCRNCYGQ